MAKVELKGVTKIYDGNVLAVEKSNVTIEEYNGSKALKIAGNGNDGFFSIELPKAVTTKYALVKVKTTPLTNDGRVDFVNAPAFKDSNGRKSMYFFSRTFDTEQILNIVWRKYG